MVTLPNLRAIDCADQVSVIHQLVSHLQLPLIGRVTLTGDVNTYSGERPLSHAVLFPSQAIGELVYLGSATDVRVTVWGDNSNVAYETSGGSTMALGLVRHLGFRGFNWDPSLEIVLSQLTTLSAGTHIRSISVIGMLSHVDYPVWNKLFKRFDELEGLVLTVRHNYPTRDEGDNDGAYYPFPRCPNLKTIEVNRWTYEVDCMDALVGCLRSRQDTGALPLETLSLVAKFESEEEWAEAVRRYTPKFKSLTNQFNLSPLSAHPDLA
ncbi:hypothetical protein C8Q79DRAFT_172396 [Trametes meyenii]|nr:hypothetical protein C8Q79DRAFT_172396 [Trametes meyenii]